MTDNARRTDIMSRFATAALCAVLLGGCVSAAPRTGTAPEPTDAGSTARELPAAPVSASMLLLEQGRAQRDAGHYDEATTTIERALRIEPNNPEIWLALAEIKLDEGDREQADLMARKALTLAGGDRSIEARANRLMHR